MAFTSSAAHAVNLKGYLKLKYKNELASASGAAFAQNASIGHLRGQQKGPEGARGALVVRVSVPAQRLYRCGINLKGRHQ